MESELFYQVDKLLDDEANKIVKVLLELYEKKTVVNKSMSKLVRELVDNKLKYYAIEIELRVRCLLPYEYYEDCSGKFSLMNRSEYSKIHIEKYSRYCMKNERKIIFWLHRNYQTYLLTYIIIKAVKKVYLK